MSLVSRKRHCERSVSLSRRLARRAFERSLPVAAQDRALNWRWARSPDRILLVRHERRRPWFHRPFLTWLSRNFPQVRSHFELALLGARIAERSGAYRLLVPWLQDPIQNWSTTAYAHACALADRFEERDIPVINPPDLLVNAAKSAGAAAAVAMGARAPRVVPLQGAGALGRAIDVIGLPVIVRSDWGHRGRVTRIERREDAWDEQTASIERPVAVEFIDTCGDDGLFRKYRYLATGERGVSVHMIASRHWEVRGNRKVLDDEIRAAELAFVTTPNPHRVLFDDLRKALGLDLVAFDYAYDRSGALVVWEANPYPSVKFGEEAPELRYRSIAVHRSLAAMAELYLSRARIQVPEALAALLEDDDAVRDRCAALRAS
jgi:hypothetical protein